MKLVEIKKCFEMDCGSPSPTIISNDDHLFLAFYAAENDNAVEEIDSNAVYTAEVVTMKFISCLKYEFGIPGNETIFGHPYSKLGMKSCAFYELHESDLIEELKCIQNIHPRYNPQMWNSYKHYILTFHDNMFECIATGFEIIEEKNSMHRQVTTILDELSDKM